MKFIKATFLFLLLLSIFSCNRGLDQHTKSEIQKPVVIESKLKTENIEVKNDSLIKSKESDSNIKIDRKSQIRSEKQIPQTSDINSKNPYWDGWVILAISSLILNLFFVQKLVKSLSKKGMIKKEGDGLRKELDSLNKWNEIISESFKKKISNLEKENYEIKKNQTESSNFDNSKINSSFQNKQSLSDEKSFEFNLKVNPSTPNTSEPITLYAEKADEHGNFSQVSEQKNEHKSIFKFYLHDKNDDTAHFEIIDSNFILKMVVNSPDIYLYTVCKPENNNQNFTGEIITTQRGIAHKVEGCWKLQDENKAIIKFQ
jgi:hypothetical protein